MILKDTKKWHVKIINDGNGVFCIIVTTLDGSFTASEYCSSSLKDAKKIAKYIINEQNKRDKKYIVSEWYE